MKMNRCYKCGREFPATTKYFNRDKTRKDGLHNSCKSCQNEAAKQWHKQNPKNFRESQIKWNKKNLEKRVEANRKWREQNREKCNDWQRKYRTQNPRILNPRDLISRSISRGIWKALKSGKNGRHWENVVGYSLNELINHLESQFAKGMTWNNYGEWHIDHIRPTSDFNFTSFNDPEFLECWSLWNLQPMWGKDNLSKNNQCTTPPLPLLVNKGER